MGDIIDFNTREKMAIAAAHGRIENKILAVDDALMALWAQIYEDAEELWESEVLDLEESVGALSQLYAALIRNPENYPSYVQIKDWLNSLQAYDETQQIEMDLEEEDDDGY